ncbi:unnamed protein product [Urochloa humidicola]
MDGDAPPMVAEEPHADPDLPLPASSPTTEGADLAERLVAIFARLRPVTIGLDHTVILSLRAAEADDAGVGADDAYAYGGFGGVPASEEAIAALPETTVGEGEATEECAVCLEGYEAGDALRTMPCAHAFHEHCIFVWLAVSRLCPLCRFALPAKVDSDTEEDDEADEEDDDDVEALMI